MKTLKITMAALALLLGAGTCLGYPYEIHMPIVDGFYMALAHSATDSNVSQKVVCSRNFHVPGFPEADPRPDWGVKGWAYDDPYYSNSSIAGVQSIYAKDLLDEGEYDLYAVNATTNDLESYVYLAAWPGLTNAFYTGVFEKNSVTYIGSLPGKKDLGLRVIKACQKKNYYLTMKAECDPEGDGYVLEAKTNRVYASFNFRNDGLKWFTLDFDQRMSINKKRTQLTLKSGATQAKVNLVRKTINLKGSVKQFLQSVDNVEFFLRINDHSGINYLNFNKQRKYRWTEKSQTAQGKAWLKGETGAPRTPFDFQGR